MNKAQRKTLGEVLNKLEEVAGVLEDIKLEEEDKVENMRDNFEGTERFQEMEDTLTQLEEADSDLSNVRSLLEAVIE